MLERSRGLQDRHRVSVASRVFLHHDGVGTVRQGGAGKDSNALSLAKLSRKGAAGRDFTDHPQLRGLAGGSGRDVG